MSTYSENDIWQNKLLTVQEVADFFRVSRVTVWRWCRRGTIPAMRIGRNWRIRQKDLLSLVENTSVELEETPLVIGNAHKHQP